MRALFLGFGLSVSGLFGATREAYVWQRQWGSEVSAALQAFQPDVDGVCVLAAEISWVGERMQVARPAINWAALTAFEKPVGLALRIGPFHGAFATESTTARAISDVAAGVLDEAARRGLKVNELQIDFDAAESKLAGYREWVAALRRRVGRTRLVVTALPVWLKHEEFRMLARAADGFVLQVHSLERPIGPAAPFSLCDPARALEWAKAADRVGVPFRVALPTYGYVLGFDAKGKFIALAAEGARPVWPVSTQVRVVRADARAMAELTRTLEHAALRNYLGVIWYRLPVAGDQLNWDAVTLREVLRGRVPAAAVRAEVSWAEPGLAEVVIANRGQTTEPLPASVVVRWAAGAHLLASDGLAGFLLETRRGEAQGIVRAVNVPADAFLAPGREARIAWLRFDHETSVEVAVRASP